MSKCAGVTEPGELTKTKPIRRASAPVRCRRCGQPLEQLVDQFAVGRRLLDVEQRHPRVVGGQRPDLVGDRDDLERRWRRPASAETSGFEAFSAEIESAPSSSPSRAMASSEKRGSPLRPCENGVGVRCASADWNDRSTAGHGVLFMDPPTSDGACRATPYST